MQKTETPIQDAFNATRTALLEISEACEALPSTEAKERARKIKAALNNSAFSVAFNVVPALLDNINRAEANRKRRKARLRVLWINKLTLGLTYNQRRELRMLSAL